jgi:hypothetical protein
MIACAPIGGRVDYTQANQNELMVFIGKTSSARQSLSFHNALSPVTKGQRSVGADLCWIVLNLRIVWYHLSRGINDENNWRPGILR